MEITINDNHFILHPSGSAFWEEYKILLISDVHLGKISHFRKHGLAIPPNAVAENFKRLDEVIEFFEPKKIIFLGDLFHSKMNNEWNLFACWVGKLDCDLVLVEGNHDIISKKYYSYLSIDVHSKLYIDTFSLTHHPSEEKGIFNFCGHIHPGIKINDIGRQSIKLACFFQRKNQMILPAFGEFTGKYFITPTSIDSVYAIANNKVLKVV